MDEEGTVTLDARYVLRLDDFMSPVKIADGFTLGDLCRIIENFEEMDVESFSRLLHCPLQPFLDECLYGANIGQITLPTARTGQIENWPGLIQRTKSTRDLSTTRERFYRRSGDPLPPKCSSSTQCVCFLRMMPAEAKTQRSQA
jgi:hypothetical protein